MTLSLSGEGGLGLPGIQLVPVSIKSIVQFRRMQGYIFSRQRSSELSILWGYMVEKFEKAEVKNYFCCRGNQRVGILTLSRCRNRVEILNLGVLDSFRGGGIAGEILKSVLNLCYIFCIAEVRLSVLDHNNAALCLYKKYGFTERISPHQDKFPNNNINESNSY